MAPRANTLSVRSVLVGSILVVLGVGNAWTAWTVAGLEGRLAALESDTRQLRQDHQVAIRHRPSPRGATAPPDARRAGATAAPEQVGALTAEALEGAIDRHTESKKVQETEKILAIYAESLAVEVEEFGEEFDISEAHRKQIVRLLVDAMHEGARLKEELTDGVISVREAKSEGEDLQNELKTALTELLGPEATDALGERIKPGRGWGS